MNAFDIPPIDIRASLEPPTGSRESQAHVGTLRERTPFHARTSELNLLNSWSHWAGCTVPDVYRDLELEYSAIRNASSLFDLSPMIKYRISGADAETLLNRVTVRDVAKLQPGRVQYTVWCDDDGKVLDDGTLFRLPDGTFRLCAQERHLLWLKRAALGLDADVEDITTRVVGLALQGPTSFAVLKAAGFESAAELRPFHFMETELATGARLMISRTGFTGDLGYELWTETGAALDLWDLLWNAGQDFGIMPIGTEALNMVRIEAGFVMTNADFIAAHQAIRPDRRRSPFEIGLGHLVDFDKGSFNGRRALHSEMTGKTSKWCLVGLDIEGNRPAHQALVYSDKTKEVGHITAATWSPSAKRSIALACLKRPFGDTRTDNLWVEIYVQYELEWTRLMERARIVPRPFYKPARRRQTPPALY